MDVKTEELQEELKLRMDVQNSELPAQVKQPDLSELREYCQKYMEQVIADGYVSPEAKELHFHIFQLALQCCYGDGIWGWNGEILTRQ